jgi:hypothetical protein
MRRKSETPWVSVLVSRVPIEQNCPSHSLVCGLCKPTQLVLFPDFYFDGEGTKLAFYSIWKFPRYLVECLLAFFPNVHLLGGHREHQPTQYLHTFVRVLLVTPFHFMSSQRPSLFVFIFPSCPVGKSSFVCFSRCFQVFPLLFTSISKFRVALKFLIFIFKLIFLFKCLSFSQSLPLSLCLCLPVSVFPA